jgi:hypothetical protein
MIRLFTAAMLLLATAIPAFACELNSASGNANGTAQSAGASQKAPPQTRS